MFIAVVIILLVLLGIFLTRKLPPETYSHWNQLFDGMQHSTNEFYTKVEEQLKSHEIDGVRFSREMLSERGILSSKREYLRIRWRDITHDIGAFPFDGGFFITAWQYKQMTGAEEAVRKIPLFGKALQQAFFPVTYYTIDTTSMYGQYVHHSLMSVIEEITGSQGLRSLVEIEKAPTMKDIFKRS